MPDQQPMTLLALMRALDAKLISGTARTWPARCPVCGCGTEIGPGGVGRLCLQCSVAEVGETWPGLAHRVSHHLTLNQWRKLETIEDVPRHRYRDWVRKFMR